MAEYTIFVINLKKDTDRMSFMASQLDNFGMAYRWHAAVHGKNYVPKVDEYDPGQAKKRGGRELLPGELGCALSHAQVIETIVREEISYALVLEDDVSLPSNFKVIIEEEVSRNSHGHLWEYLLFDYIPVGLPFLRIWWRGVVFNYSKQTHLSQKIRFLIMQFCKSLYIVPISIFEKCRERVCGKNPGPVRFFRPVYFAGAYLITLEGAKKLKKLSHPVVYTADQLPNKARRLARLHFKAYCPLVVKQEKRKFGSSILDLQGDALQLDYEK